MDDLDLDWMTPSVRRAFLEGVRVYAQAVRDGAVMHMQDGAQAMERAAQLHLGAERDAAPSDTDPSI